MRAKDKSGPGLETEKHGIVFTTKYSKNLQHICTRSPILVVALHAALENGSTVPAGFIDIAQSVECHPTNDCPVDFGEQFLNHITNTCNTQFRHLQK